MKNKAISLVLIIMSIAGLFGLYMLLLFMSLGGALDVFDFFSYKKDKTELYDIAVQLGHTSKNEINSFRSKGFSDYDYTSVVFSTTESLDMFKNRLNKLSLSESAHYYPKNDEFYSQFLSLEANYSGDESRKLLLSDKRANDSFIPKDIPLAITRRTYHLSEGKFIEVQFARLQTEQVYWIANNIRIKGNIVIVTLSR